MIEKEADNMDSNSTQATSPLTRKLHVGRPNIGDREKFQKIVDEIFERCWFSNNGQVVQEFEAKLCEFLGVKHCIPVCNATVGMQLVCHALEMTGEVIVPDYTFVATPHAVHWEGLKPVFADVDPVSHCICPESAASLITPETSAIVGVHIWGHPCNTDALEKLASENNIDVVYDSAHAFGCAHQGKMIGNFGKCEVFSFHATKFFNTFEGGAISTNDDELARKIRLMKNFGFAGMDNVIHLGTNAKMTEICAAMGISVLSCLDEILDRNRSNYELYKERLNSVSGLRFYPYDHLEKTNWQYIVIEIDSSQSPDKRNGLFELLHANNVMARRYFYPGCHQMEPYRTIYEGHPLDLANSQRLCNEVLCLPNGTGVTHDEIAEICRIIAEYVEA